MDLAWADRHATVGTFVRRHWWACMAVPVLLGLLGGFAGYVNWNSHSDEDFARHNVLMKHSQEEAAYARQLAQYDQTVIKNRRVFLDITRAEFDRIVTPEQKAWLLHEYRKFDITRVSTYDGHDIRPFQPSACTVELCFVPIFVESLHDDPVHNTKYVQVGALEDMSRTLIVDQEQFWRLRKLVIRIDAILFAARRQQIADYEQMMQLRASLDVLRTTTQKIK
ncbi:hypothetical protein [Komagataeibacter sp. FNDCR2]|uniref:hypothetical protein n=1 Tax=Komagataeibacter sp. FNDCR2 TaxID=2878682 RepID=UPI001E2AD07F|nr:hypothetical protein [Komagataeibacter sp. FNDCR2]MCE2576162.1 hypothetical protein [Komagataeibacter sp. FNDCR2]